MKTRHGQGGMTAIGWLLVLGLIAFFALIALRMIPLYLEYAKVASVFEGLANEPGISQQSRTDIIGLITKRFQINDVNNVDPRITKVVKERGKTVISIGYERRQHLIANVDVVAKFDKQIEVPGN
jgi:hypothetical protein